MQQVSCGVSAACCLQPLPHLSAAGVHLHGRRPLLLCNAGTRHAAGLRAGGAADRRGSGSSSSSGALGRQRAGHELHGLGARPIALVGSSSAASTRRLHTVCFAVSRLLLQFLHPLRPQVARKQINFASVLSATRSHHHKFRQRLAHSSSRPVAAAAASTAPRWAARQAVAPLVVSSSADCSSELSTVSLVAKELQRGISSIGALVHAQAAAAVDRFRA